MAKIGLDREELAWAAGFFDGEGNIYYSNKNKRRSPRLILQIAQVRREPLDKFQSVFNVGSIGGPYKPKTANSSPYFTYKVESFQNVQFICAAFWEFLSEPKKESFILMLKQYLEFLKNPQCIYGHPLKHGRGNRLFCSTCRSTAAKTAMKNRWGVA